MILRKWTGDLDGMIQRRLIRVLTTYSKTNYFIDQGTQHGRVYDSFSLFADDLNKKLKSKNIRVEVFSLPVAQGYLESQLEQNAKSGVGAIGVMQVMPATGAEQKFGDIPQLEPNIHAGVKYIRFMIDQYDANEPMDNLNRGLFAFASYNAGPGRISQLRQRAANRGLDPNKWFNNVEVVVANPSGGRRSSTSPISTSTIWPTRCT
jgi:membrane-bound lytic murein transglycosylase MltF